VRASVTRNAILPGTRTRQSVERRFDVARAMTGLEKNHVSAQTTSAVPDARFVSLQHTGTEFTWAADGECRIEWVDGRGSDFMGEPLAGLKWSQVTAVHPDDCETIERQWRDAVSSGTAYESEHRLRGRNGEFRWFAARAFPLRNRSGEIIRWFGSSADIHEIKLAEQAFRETELRIDAALGLVRSPRRTRSTSNWPPLGRPRHSAHPGESLLR